MVAAAGVVLRSVGRGGAGVTVPAAGVAATLLCCTSGGGAAEAAWSLRAAQMGVATGSWQLYPACDPTRLPPRQLWLPHAPLLAVAWLRQRAWESGAACSGTTRRLNLPQGRPLAATCPGSAGVDAVRAAAPAMAGELAGGETSGPSSGGGRAEELHGA